MGGIGRFLTSPLATVQGDPLTLADLLFTVASVLFFYLLAQVAAGAVQAQGGAAPQSNGNEQAPPSLNRLPVHSHCRHLYFVGNY